MRGHPAISRTSTVNGLTVTKSASVASFAEAGTVITYLFTLTNSGTSQVNSLRVFDHNPPGSVGVPLDVCDGNGIIAPGTTRHCVRTYTTTRADVDRGFAADELTVDFHRPGSGNRWQASDALVIPVRAVPAIGVLKVADPDSFNEPGELIRYAYTVTNSGTEPLSGITVADNPLGAIDCPRASLAPREEMTCTIAYVTTGLDVGRGSITDSVLATGTASGGTRVDASATFTIGFERPGIRISKFASPASYGAPGQVITYTYLLYSVGGVALHDVTVTDSRLGRINCLPTSLAGNESGSCGVTYTTTAADIARGDIHNSVDAVGLTPGGMQLTDSAAATVILNTAPRISITKGAFPDMYGAAGEHISYSYTVVNTGNVILHAVTLHDSRLGVVHCLPATLSPGHEAVCTADYLTTPADVGAGYITDIVTATGTPPSGPAVTATSVTVTVRAVRAARIGIVKRASVARFGHAGTLIRYFYRVTNHGAVILRDVRVADSRGIAVRCPHASLEPGAEMTCIARYRATSADVRQGRIVNTGWAAGLTPAGPRSRRGRH